MVRERLAAAVPAILDQVRRIGYLLSFLVEESGWIGERSRDAVRELDRLIVAARAAEPGIAAREVLERSAVVLNVLADDLDASLADASGVDVTLDEPPAIRSRLLVEVTRVARAAARDAASPTFDADRGDHRP